jgi:hypothetical protein
MCKYFTDAAGMQGRSSHSRSRSKLRPGHNAVPKSRDAVMGGFAFRRLSRHINKAEKRRAIESARVGLPHQWRAGDPCLLASDGIFPRPPSSLFRHKPAVHPKHRMALRTATMGPKTRAWNIPYFFY